MNTKVYERKLISTPKRLDIAITGRCNLRCRYCFYADEMMARNDLPTEMWVSFFKELSTLGIMDVTLTGGEPFARSDLFELIDSIIANRMRYSILSNGTLIDEKLLSQFESGKRFGRLNFIQISIDGSKSEIHNKSRPNSYYLALKGLQLLKAKGFPVVVRTTINRHNLEDLENIANLLLSEIGLNSFSTNEAMPIGSGCMNSADVTLSPAEQEKAMNIIAKLLERYPGQLIAKAGPQAKQKMFSDMEYARKTGVMSKSWRMGYLTACGCVFSCLDIRHDGAIVPCHIMYDLVLGRVGIDSLQEIWLNNPVLKALRERRSIPMEKVPGCEYCEWAPYCNGGCPGLAYQLTGNFNRANPSDCYRAFLAGTGNFNVMDI